MKHSRVLLTKHTGWPLQLQPNDISTGQRSPAVEFGLVLYMMRSQQSDLSSAVIWWRFTFLEDCAGMTGGEAVGLEGGLVRRLMKVPIAITLQTKGRKEAFST